MSNAEAPETTSETPSEPAKAAAGRPVLNQEDIARLIRSENIDDRAVATHKLCRSMEHRALTERERDAAHAIIRMMAQDAAELVRRSLAITLRHSDILPHDVAMRLAADVTSVAVPVISHSPVFSDDDLRAIIQSGSPQRQIAVAKRDTLSEAVTTALAEQGVEEAVVLAAANDNASFSEDGLTRMLDRFGTSEVVHNVLVHRSSLPVGIAERLISVVSGALKHHLVTSHHVNPETAVKVMETAQERATLDMADMSGVNRDPQLLAKHLYEVGKLTPSLLLRALCRGQIGFFEHAMAYLSRVPHERTWLMVNDAGTLGFRAIYDRAGLPARLFQTFRIALTTLHALRDEGVDLAPIAFQERLIERFLTQLPFAPREDLVYLFERLDRDSSGRAWREDSNNAVYLAA
jgi:uncharacterized protein (DUF2336 family)